MVRYYGFLANCKRGELSTKVYIAIAIAIGIEMKARPQKLSFTSLMKKFTHVDPCKFVLCGSRIWAEELLAQHRQEFKTERWLR